MPPKAGRSRVRIRVSTVDCRDLGCVNSPIDAAVLAVSALGRAPEILCMSGMTDLPLASGNALDGVTRQLSSLRSDGDAYESFVSNWPGSGISSALWLSAGHVRPVGHHRHPEPLARRARYHHTVEARIGDHLVLIKGVGSNDPIVQSVVDSQLAGLPAILMGSFGSGSALHRILRAGFWDAGSDSGPPTANHILVSAVTPAHLEPRSHVVDPTTGAVACDLNFATAEGGETRWPGER